MFNIVRSGPPTFLNPFFVVSIILQLKYYILVYFIMINLNSLLERVTDNIQVPKYFTKGKSCTRKSDGKVITTLSI